MNITQIQANDEIIHNGISYIALTQPERVSDRGDMAHTIRLSLLRTGRAGIHPDGTLEFGATSVETSLLDDTTEVEIIRSDVRWRDVSNYEPAITTEQVIDVLNGGAPPVPGRSINQLAAERKCRAELARVALRRTAHLEQGKAEETSFRIAVRNAVKAGIPVAEIREATGLSRERVYQIRDGRR